MNARLAAHAAAVATVTATCESDTRPARVAFRDAMSTIEQTYRQAVRPLQNALDRGAAIHDDDTPIGAAALALRKEIYDAGIVAARATYRASAEAALLTYEAAIIARVRARNDDIMTRIAVVDAANARGDL
jgi:lysozyme family protein